MSADHSIAPTDVQATIAQLWVYPVKSCAGISLTEAELTDTGLLRHMLVQGRGSGQQAAQRVSCSFDFWISPGRS